MAVGGIASACAFETPEVEHPVPDSLASAYHPGLVAEESVVPASLPGPFVPDSLIATFGAQEMPEADIIGRIEVASMWRDEIFVLDAVLHTVHVLDVRARTQERVGRPGQGPGELAIPRGLALSEDRIYVGDERQLIHEFIRTEGGWSWAQDISVPFLPLDICAMDDSLYVLAIGNDISPVIHRFEHGERVASFGVPYRWGDAFIRHVTAEGRLACLPEIGGVAWVPARMNEVHLYGTDGTLRWIARLPDYKPMSIIEDNVAGSVAMGLAGGLAEMHMLHAVAPVAGNLLVQLSLYDQKAVEADTPKTIQSYVIDLASGATSEIDFPYSGLIGVGEGRMALFTNDPWPKVDVFSVSEAG